MFPTPLYLLATIARRFKWRFGAPKARSIWVDPDACTVWNPRGPCTLVRCLSGTAWITMAGDPRDYVLQPGEQILLRGQGLAAMQALGNARMHCSICESATIAPACHIPARPYTAKS